MSTSPQKRSVEAYRRRRKQRKHKKHIKINEETERKRQEEVNRKLAADNAIAQAEKMKNDLLIIKREYKIVTKLLDEKRKTETLHSVSGRNRHMLSSMNHVKQDKFRFLASKFNSCSKLTSSVLSFPSYEILLGK